MSEKTTSCLERFLRYVQVYTTSDPFSATYPTTPRQFDLLRILEQELRELGLEEVDIDQHGYVMGTIPATTLKEGVPALAFVAHVDTSPDMPGDAVKPIVHRHYAGNDIVLPDDPTAVLKPAEAEDLALAGRPRHRDRFGRHPAGRRRQGRRRRDHGRPPNT